MKLGMTTPNQNRKPVFPQAKRLFAARVAPDTVIRTAINPNPLMYRNDELSDCTAVSTYNGARAICKLVHNTSLIDLNVVTDNVVNFYSTCSGYNPNIPGTDNGADIDHVMKTAMIHGVPTMSDTLYPQIGEFDINDLESIRNGIDMFGVLHLGVGLALADQNTNRVWDITTPGDQSLASWGWHDLNIWEYAGKEDTSLVTLLTWGKKQYATWRWVKARAAICAGMAFRQLTTPEMKTVNGATWDNFVADNHNLIAIP